MTSRKAARRHRGTNRMVPRPVREIPEGTDLRARGRDPVAAALAYWEDLDDPLFVYFIQGRKGGPVKIGKARNPVARLRELQCGNPDLLIIRAVLLATEDAEEKIHRQWQSVRVRGEWFGGGLEDGLICLARAASEWQVAEHQAAQYKDGHLIYLIASEGCGRVAFPRHRLLEEAA